MATQATQTVKRGASFSEIEQVTLTQSWLEISMDPIHGNDQKGTDFYKRIAEIFKEKMGVQYINRSPESLHSHWRDNIQCNVAKFSSAYAKATSRVISGYNPDDYIRDAQVLFISENKHKKPFKAIKCWEILKSHAKWCPSSSESSGEGVLNVGPMLDRPIGCHTAKKAKVEAKVEAKSKVNAENVKGERMKQVMDAISDTHRDRQSIATKSYDMIEKSNALKELKFFENDMSDEGKAIAKQLRSNYINKYVLTSTPTTAVTVAPMADVSASVEMTTTTSAPLYATPMVNTTPMVDMTTVVPVDMFLSLPVISTPTLAMVELVSEKTTQDETVEEV